MRNRSVSSVAATGSSVARADFDRLPDDDAQPRETDDTPREGLCRADETDRHKWCSCHERHARGTPVPHTITADSALRENRDRLARLERLPHPRESELVAVATLNPDRAKSVEHPCEQSGPPEFRLREETQFPRDCGP